MNCRTCNRNDAWTVRTIVDKGEMLDSCNFCGGFTMTPISDVYFPAAHSCENITDDRGQPIHFTSRSEKARVMREKGISEIGDRVHGARYIPKPRVNSWYQMRRALGKLK